MEKIVLKVLKVLNLLYGGQFSPKIILQLANLVLNFSIILI